MVKAGMGGPAVKTSRILNELFALKKLTCEGFEKQASAGGLLRELYSVMQVTPPEQTPAIADSIVEFLVSKRQSGRREIYLKGLRTYLVQFAQGREGKPIGEFIMTDIERWFAGREEAPSSRNSNLGRLSALFNWAWRRGYLMHNPCRKIETIRLETEPPDILTMDQCREALDWTAKNERRFLAWLVLTLLVGLRPESEADEISWEEIRLDRKVIKISGKRTKTRRHRIIDLDMMPVAAEWLCEARLREAELPVVYMARRRFLKRLQDHLALPDWKQDLLRHTAASYLFAYHQDAGKVAAFLRNSAGILLKRYRALVAREDALQFFALQPPKCPRVLPPTSTCRARSERRAKGLWRVRETLIKVVGFPIY
jgi:site-specific recombinase XerD